MHALGLKTITVTVNYLITATAANPATPVLYHYTLLRLQLLLQC